VWVQAFQNCLSPEKQFEYGLLKRKIFPRDLSPFARATAVMSSRIALKSLSEPKRFIFMVPHPEDELSWVIPSTLLITDLVRKQTSQTLLKGDLLLVTNTSGSALAELQRIKLGDTSLQEIWQVDSYSRYKPSLGSKPAVFVANVGWVKEGIPERTIGTVIINGMHPRTLGKVPGVLATIKDVPLSFVICPPLLEHELKDLGYPEMAETWLWDPSAQHRVAEILSVPSRVDLSVKERDVWICPDPEIDGLLSEVHALLGAAQRESRKAFPPFWGAWGIYHQLRNLSVSLSQFEDAAFDTWGASTIRKRLGFLVSEWPEELALEARWRQIIQGLEKTYEVLLKHQEPAKFWAIAQRVEHYLKQDEEAVRIVVPSEREVALLSVALSHVTDDWGDAQEEGRIEVISARAEARMLSGGNFRKTILTGYRAGQHRHLDLYPGYKIEIVAYPYEASVDQSLQSRIYNFTEEFQHPDARKRALDYVGMECPSSSESLISPRPAISLMGEIKHNIEKVIEPLQDPSAFDMEKLAESGFSEDWTDEPISAFGEHKGDEKEITEVVQIIFVDGQRVNYLRYQGVDVYSPGTEQIYRYEAYKVKSGMRVVTMVDGVYENLHERLVEALNSRLNAYHQMLMSLWEQAKLKALLMHNGNRRDLHRALAQKGLSTEYAAIVSLFRDGDFEIIAPQQFEDMKILAEHSGVYPKRNLVSLTFKVIQNERGRRKKAGRALHGLLRAIASGDGYSQALSMAKEIGTEISEVLEAVEIKEVENVVILRKRDS